MEDQEVAGTHGVTEFVSQHELELVLRQLRGSTWGDLHRAAHEFEDRGEAGIPPAVLADIVALAREAPQDEELPQGADQLYAKVNQLASQLPHR